MQQRGRLNGVGRELAIGDGDRLRPGRRLAGGEVELDELDASPELRILGSVVLPLIRPAIAAQFILWFMAVWNDYLAPLIYLNTPERQTLQVVIANFNANYAIQTDYPLIMAASVIALIPVFVIFLAFQRQIIESVALTGTKG